METNNNAKSPGNNPQKRFYKSNGAKRGRGNKNFRNTRPNQSMPTGKGYNFKPEKLDWTTVTTTGYDPNKYPNQGLPIKVIPLGGSEEVGINSTVFEQDNDIVIIDMGFGFPDEDQYGIDYIIPNYEYVKANLSKLRGVLITHGHMDHIGAIPYVIKELGFPMIYAPKLASDLIREKAREFKLEDQIKIQEIDNDTKFNLGSFGVSYFRVNHNIPYSYGIILKSKYGNIIHTGDFKFDNTPYHEPTTEYNKLAKAGDEGVLLLCSDSTNAYKSGWSVAETSVTKDLDYLIQNAKGRVIAATFASLVTRLVQISDIAMKYNRKIVPTGRSIENIINIAKNLGLMETPTKFFIKPEEANQFPDNEILILATGSQGEKNASLARMAIGEHKLFDIRQSDTIILSSSKVPGNETSINKLINQLTNLGADVYHSDMMDVHAGGHAHAEDHKMLYHLTKPKFLMPAYGEPYMLHMQKKTAMKIGFPESNIILMENGSVLEVNPNSARITGKVNAQPLLVDGLGIGDIGQAVLEDRHRLSDDGIVVIVVNLDCDNRSFRSEVGVVTRGFIYVKSSEELMADIREKVKAIVADSKDAEATFIRDRINREVGTFLFQKTQREPMIMSVVNLV